MRHRASRLERLSIVVRRWAWRIRAFGRPVTVTPWPRVDRGTPIDAAIAHVLEAFELDETYVRWRADPKRGG